MGTRGWFQKPDTSSVEFFLTEGDSVERYRLKFTVGSHFSHMHKVK